MKALALLVLMSAPLFGAAQYQRTITLQAAQAGASDSTNFPVLVKLSGNEFKSVANGGHVQNSSGFDILFWKDLAHTTAAAAWEMDFYDATNGVAWAWVKVDTVSHTTSTVIYVTYGDPSISTFQSTASNVWTNNFTYVWHGGSGSSLSLSDSTSNNNTATNNGTTTATTGQIAGGGNFVAASSQFLTVDTDPAAVQTTTLTMTAWAKFSGTALGYILRKTGNGFRIFNNTGQSAPTLGTFDSGGNAVSTTQNGTHNTNDGNWHYYAATFDATSSVTNALKVYQDNQTVITANAVATGNIKYTAGSFQVGANGGANFWNGQIDEVRIASGVRSADWITTEFNNQSNPTSFAVVGQENILHGTLATLGVGN